MTHFKIEWEANSEDPLPICSVKVTEGPVTLTEYQTTFSDLADILISSEVRELQPRTIIGHQRLAAPRQIIGLTRVPNPMMRNETPIMQGAWIKHIHSKEKNTDLVVCEAKKMQRDMHYYNMPLQNVGHPRMLFFYKIDHNGRIQDKYAFAIKEGGRIQEDTLLYKFPYANVTSSGSICMGTNQLPSIRNLYQCSSLHNLFFNSPSSTCYYEQGKQNASGYTDLRELYKEMEGREFPDEWLLSHEMTFREFCNKY